MFAAIQTVIPTECCITSARAPGLREPGKISLAFYADRSLTRKLISDRSSHWFRPPGSGAAELICRLNIRMLAGYPADCQELPQAELTSFGNRNCLLSEELVLSPIYPL